MMGKLYEFSGDSCFVMSPSPPRHWYNYLWSDKGYIAQISQMGHGRSYVIDEDSNVCYVNTEGCRYLYIRDDDSNDCFNIGRGPSGTGTDDFVCEHHPAYTRLSGKRNGLSAVWRLFVPVGGWGEIWELTIKNNGEHGKNLSVFALMSFEMEGFKYPRYYEMYRFCQTRYDERLCGIYLGSKHPYAPNARYNAYLACSRKPYAYDGDLSAFLGTESIVTRNDSSQAGQYGSPGIIRGGLDCSCSETSNFMLGAVLQNKAVLSPGEKIKLIYAAGVCSSLEEGTEATRLAFCPGGTEGLLGEARAIAESRKKLLPLRTPEERINRLFSGWIQKQIEFCVVGKKGVRDNLQIAVAMLNYDAARAEKEILECVRHQFRDGSAVLTWEPYDSGLYSDQPFWIIWAVVELIKETGKFGLLETVIPYQDEGEGTLLEHMRAAANRMLTKTGPNGLPLILTADWNDGLNCMDDPEAESIMLAHQMCLALSEYSKLCDKLGDREYAQYLAEKRNEAGRILNDVAWDGDRYVRVKSKKGDIGGRSSEGSKLYLNAQVWAILADIPGAKRRQTLLETIDSMEHDFGFPINTPAYEEYSTSTGRISAMLPGLYENGGVYCHATGFKAYMDCAADRPVEALRSMLKIIPDHELNPVGQSGAEPYVMTNCYSTHPKYYGKSYHSWTTGTSAWTLMTVCEGIFGIKRDYDGLRISPCFVKPWEKASISRSFRSGRYDIQYRRGQIDGKMEIYMEGEKLRGNLLPLLQPGQTAQVEVVLRAEA